MTKPALFAALASVFLAAGAHAQKQNQPAAGNDSLFSSNSNLVLVDTIVTDKKGAYIGDLTRKDFKVREDGKEQTLTSFSHVTGAPDDQERYLVLLFDNVTGPQTGQHDARDAATEFIGSNAGPNRLIKVKRETAAGTAVVPLGIVLPTGALGPGSYTAQITAQDAAGNRSTRSIIFELEP